MSTDRLDELLERAASGAELPTDMTQAERAELESLVAEANSLRTTAGVVEDEAAASLPAARARFERFMAAREGETTVAPAPRGWFRRVPRRGVMLIGAAAAIGVIAAGGVFAFQAAFSTTSSADAEVLAPDDYAQVQGVVTGIEHADATTTLHVESAFGVVNVTVGPATAVERDTAATSPAAISAGELVSVSGVAGTARTLTADAVAIESAGGSQLVSAPVSQLRRLGTPLEGKIVAFAVSPEGTQARVLVRTGGKYYVVPLEGAAVARLLTRSANALGTDVTVNNGTSAADGVFGLVLGGGAQQPGMPSAMGIRGVVVARRGNELEVAVSRDARYTVVVGPSTRIILAKSGLQRSDVRTGDAVVGHVLSVAGARDESKGRIAAELVVVGERYGGS